MGKGGGRGWSREQNDLDNVTPFLRISSSEQLDESSGSPLPPLTAPIPPTIQHTPDMASNDAPSNSHAAQNMSSGQQPNESGPHIQSCDIVGPSTGIGIPGAASNDAPTNSHAAQSSNGAVPANAARTSFAIPTHQNSEDVRGPDRRIHLSMKGDT